MQSYVNERQKAKVASIIGSTFGRLTVVEYSRSYVSPSGYIRSFVRCLCQCGSEKEIDLVAMRAGRILSCGCVRNERTSKARKTHGMSKTNTYKIWAGMVGRCTNPRNKSFKFYGGRGIKVCERWLCFDNFYSDMGERKPGESIERINVNGGYEPSNCCWIPIDRQHENRRDVKITPAIGAKILDMAKAGVPVASIRKTLDLSDSSVRKFITKKESERAACRK